MATIGDAAASGPRSELMPAPVSPLDPIAPVVQRPAGAADPDDIRGAFAANTQRAYRSDWRDWSAWCADVGWTSLPASPEDVAAYLKVVADRGARYSTVARRVAAIAAAHQVAGLAFDRKAPAIAFALKRLARELGTAKRGKDALMTADVVAMLPRGSDLLEQRDRALILLAFASALRRSELVALDVTDVEWKRDGAALHVRRSKGDQEGQGQVVPVSYGRREATCPLRALKVWLAAAGIAEGAIFRRVFGRTLGERLDGRSVYDVVRRRAAEAGLDASRFGAHSTRVGHVTQSLDNGADPLKAQAQARHKKLDTTLGYNRAGAQLFKDNSSGKLGL